MSAEPSADRWRVEEHHDATFVIVDESGNPILISGMTRTVPNTTRSNPAFRRRVLADVTLAAAAPEMLAALKSVAQHGRIDNSEERMCMVGAAIAKAEAV